MLNKNFELHKIKKEIKQHGGKYDFYRSDRNEFGELTDGEEKIATIEALYHEENSHVYLTSDDTTYIESRSKKTPNLLCAYTDALKLKVHDKVIINNKSFEITAITNIQEWNIVADISLEVNDNGFPT